MFSVSGPPGRGVRELPESQRAALLLREPLSQPTRPRPHRGLDVTSRQRPDLPSQTKQNKTAPAAEKTQVHPYYYTSTIKLKDNDLKMENFMCNLSFSHITPHWPTAKAIASLHSRSIWIKNRSLGRSLMGDVADPWETPLTASCSSYQIPRRALDLAFQTL